ncbi:hypothetical protein N7G274_005506 [Stereocaulon virgatum]|uniref:Uncharacterized protein n=1 Tax=Stereocaulon virgatum TaxID=373712 RepID=A0ABR4A739_9LECA
MADYIGSRISLISKRDIRYVGTLHEISSENSTVALEQVKSFGTEGRDPENEIPPSDNVYEYIVFRGSDVKDLRIEKEPEKKTVQQPQVPDDPAILGNARPVGTPSAPPQAPIQQLPQQNRSVPSQQTPNFQQHQHFPSQQQSQRGPGRFQQQPPFPYNPPPPPYQRLGPQGPGPQGFPPYGYHGMPYGSPPPGWYPPSGQGFPHAPPAQFYPPPGPFGLPGQPPMQQGPPGQQESPTEQPSNTALQAAIQQEVPVEKPAATVKLPSSSTTPAPSTVIQNGPPPPTKSKPNVAEALAPPAPTIAKEAPGAAKAAPKSGRILPAVPMMSPAAKPKVPFNGTSQLTATKVVPLTTQAQVSVSANPAAPRPVQVPTKSLVDANRDARAAVAAAMAKLPPAPGQKKQTNAENNALDNLTKKVNEMRTNDNIRTPRQPGTGGYAAGHRGGRGGHRGGRPRDEQTRKMEVPKTDYDFAEANAKFNKQDLVKEAVATGETIGSPADSSNAASAEASINGARHGSEQNITIPSIVGYNKSSSFFDNISSESKDRDDKRLGGREFRSEEQRKNLETFGQGSVDNGYRGGFRGRGRGRGFRGQRGSFSGRGRGSVRGNGAVAAES